LIGQLQGYDGDPSLLGKVDQMLLELTKIEHFKEHMQCLSIKSQFQEHADALMNILNICLLAVEQMKNSKRFKIMLTVILKMGNFMNGGSRRGGAFGVKLDVLTKFETTKSKCGKFTLIHFLVQQLKTNEEDVLKLPDDLYATDDASKYTLGQLQGDFAALRKGMKTVLTEVEWAKKAEDAQPFVELMNPFAMNAKNTVDEAEQKLQLLKNSFEKLVTDFGENAAKTGKNSFLKMYFVWFVFVIDINACYDYLLDFLFLFFN
jgi:hypothetical protein